jgi:hypothetical protein
MSGPGIDGVRAASDDGSVLVHSLGGLMYLYSDVVTIDPELRPEAQALRTALGADRPEDGVPASRASILMVSARSCASARPYVAARTPRGRVLVVIITGRPPDEQVWQLMAAGQ